MDKLVFSRNKNKVHDKIWKDYFNVTLFMVTNCLDLFIILRGFYFNIIPMTSNWNWYMGDFLKSFIWSSMDHSKEFFKDNYLIFKPNYFLNK